MSEIRRFRRDYFFQSLKRMFDGIPNEDWAVGTIELAKAKLELIETLWVKLETAHLEMLSKDGAVNHSIIYDAQEMYLYCKSTWMQKIAQNAAPINVPRPSSPSVRSESIADEIPNEIGRFNGDYTKWYEFREKFAAKMHTYEALINDAQKKIILKKAVTDRAARVLDTCTVTDANY